MSGTDDTLCGEVRTCLLPTRHAVNGEVAEVLLRLRPDERVSLSQRPNLYAVSPDILTGVDCRLPTANMARVRAVGTVATRAVLTEGRVLQATACFRVAPRGQDRRGPWGYYLVRPGVVVPLGRLPQRELTQGFLRGHQPGELDVGSIAEGLLAHICRQDDLLDQDRPLAAPGTRLRFAAAPGPDGEPARLVRFTLAEQGVRTVELRVPQGTEPRAVAGLCEDLALHDWLLTTVVNKLDGIQLGSMERTAALKVLRPLVDHLLHLWMPGARVDRSLTAPWEALEEDPGFTRQWQTQVQRIRDQLALQAVLLQSNALAAS
ncbi:SCO2521 family protein [Streptomyces pseudovenezuelae]|uniref:SCO2521 family protein n=1 Tax=Streptomyces pseudovenezuelae TaxID=67350 RepID=A0ABZ1WUT5_9ACTN|nr:SCO2521 family protein [Streptomyces pseudovenezuelae]